MRLCMATLACVFVFAGKWFIILPVILGNTNAKKLKLAWRQWEPIITIVAQTFVDETVLFWLDLWSSLSDKNMYEVGNVKKSKIHIGAYSNEHGPWLKKGVPNVLHAITETSSHSIHPKLFLCLTYLLTYSYLQMFRIYQAVNRYSANVPDKDLKKGAKRMIME